MSIINMIFLKNINVFNINNNNNLRVLCETPLKFFSSEYFYNMQPNWVEQFFFKNLEVAIVYLQNSWLHSLVSKIGIHKFIVIPWTFIDEWFWLIPLLTLSCPCIVAKVMLLGQNFEVQNLMDLHVCSPESKKLHF